MSDNNELQPEAEPYEVGFGHPPKETQFRPGQSGNPGGRPRGSKAVRDAFLKELWSEAPADADGCRITNLEAIIKAAVKNARAGEPRSTALALKYADQDETQTSTFTLVIEGA